MESLSEKEKSSADPFAADIFAEHSRKSSADENSAENAAAEKQNVWSANLPRARRAAVDWNVLWMNLPPEFFDQLPEKLAAALEKFLNLPDKKAVEFLPLIEREIKPDELSQTENSWWLSVKIENSDAEIFFESDYAFAVRLVEQTLGEAVSEDAEQIRELTASEKIVLEFLSLNLVHQTNKILRSPIFKFNSLENRIPVSLEKNLRRSESSTLVVNWQIVHESLPGIVKMYHAPKSLRALQPAENQVLRAASFRRAAPENARRRVKNLRMRLALGSAELSVAELAALEIGDVILPRENTLTATNGNLTGRAEILVGDGENARIGGAIITENFALSSNFEEIFANDDNKISVRRLNSNDLLKIVVENLPDDEFPAIADESMAETDENLTDETAESPEIVQAGLAIENLSVNLRVELEARKLTLSEVGNLRENQILELGARPTDAVNLLLDNQIVGRGELVLVEDRLGVRITKLLR